MADKGLLVVVLALTYLPDVLLGSLSEGTSSPFQAPSSSDLYTESPCELRALSAWKDVQGNVWGLGDGNLWWFNATNLSWSLLPLPNGNLTSDSWKVTCGNPKKYVALQGPSGTLVLHLPWQHWQQVDTDDVSGGNVDANASWCASGVLYAADPMRETLYQLDHEEGRWVVQSDLPEIDDINGTTVTGMVKTWLGPDGQFILAEKQDSCSHVIGTNASGMPWVVFAKDSDQADWPDFDLKDSTLALTWRQGTDKLWLWKDEGSPSEAEIWSFDTNTTLWERANQGFVSGLPSLKNVLATWEDGDKFCILKRSLLCNALYSISQTQCWTEEDIKSSAEQLTTSVTTSVTAKPAVGNFTPTSRVISPPSSTSEATSPSKTQDFEASKPIIIKHATQNNWRTSERTTDVISIVPARNTPWHQHTSVFGSVIFFGTSLTIFGLVGFFWCVRRCVHFPKEALLLRDPPSVRYTAIPDSLGYDSRKPTPATYTVIPDSIA